MMSACYQNKSALFSNAGAKFWVKTAGGVDAETSSSFSEYIKWTQGLYSILIKNNIFVEKWQDKGKWV